MKTVLIITLLTYTVQNITWTISPRTMALNTIWVMGMRNLFMVPNTTLGMRNLTMALSII